MKMLDIYVQLSRLKPLSLPNSSRDFDIDELVIFLELITSESSQDSDKPTHPRSLSTLFAAQMHKVC